MVDIETAMTSSMPPVEVLDAPSSDIKDSSLLKETQLPPPTIWLREYIGESPVNIPTGKRVPETVRPRVLSSMDSIERKTLDVVETASVLLDFKPEPGTVMEIEVPGSKPVYFAVREPQANIDLIKEPAKKDAALKVRASSVFVERVFAESGESNDIIDNAKREGRFISTTGLREVISPDARQVWVRKEVTIGEKVL